MPYEPVYERFEVVGQDGRRRTVGFRKAGFLVAGEQPELYFFAVNGEEAVVGLSGEALRQFQQGRRYLSREEKIDLAGCFLKRVLEAGKPLVSENLYIRGGALEELTKDLGILP